METVGGLVGLILGVIIAGIINGFVLYIVGKLNLGIEIDGFGPAFIAAIVIAIISGIITWIWGLLGFAPGAGLWGAIIHLITAAIVLMLAGNMVRGLRVHGFLGALVAAVAMSVVAWLITYLVGLIIATDAAVTYIGVAPYALI